MDLPVSRGCTAVPVLTSTTIVGSPGPAEGRVDVLGAELDLALAWEREGNPSLFPSDDVPGRGFPPALPRLCVWRFFSTGVDCATRPLPGIRLDRREESAITAARMYTLVTRGNADKA